MIEIKSNTRLQLTEKGKKLFLVDKTSSENVPSKLIGKYEFSWRNNLHSYHHSKSFGSRDDFEYGSYAGVVVVVKNNHIEISPFSYGGMCGLEFTENDRVKDAKKPDEQIINYTLNLVKVLIEQGIVLSPEILGK